MGRQEVGRESDGRKGGWMSGWVGGWDGWRSGKQEDHQDLGVLQRLHWGTEQNCRT